MGFARGDWGCLFGRGGIDVRGLRSQPETMNEELEALNTPLPLAMFAFAQNTGAMR